MTHEKTEMDYLREIARWTREAALPLVRERVERLLDTETKKRLYAAMESGTATKVALSAATGLNRSRNINPLLQAWEAEGIVERGSNPPKATFSLAELAIMPAPPKLARAKKNAA